LKVGTNTETYWERYWRENKDKILAKRRARYANDPEYREAIKERSRKRWREELRKGGRTKGKKPGKRYLRPKVVSIRGEDVLVYGIGEFADLIGYTVATLKNWERLGVLPPATAVDGHGRRWYSKAFIEWFDGVIDAFRDKGWELETFKEAVEVEYERALREGTVEGSVASSHATA
jgi:hypothetical protein